MRGIPAKKYLCLFGDLNAKIGSDYNTRSRCIVRFGIGYPDNSMAMAAVT